jgi:hypothetical protein
MDPNTAEFYLHLAREDQALKDPQMTAVMVPENAEVEGMTFNVLNTLKEATGPLPWAVCAIVQSDTGQSLNYGCAWLRASTCTALADLSQAYVEARQPLARIKSGPRPRSSLAARRASLHGRV